MHRYRHGLLFTLLTTLTVLLFVIDMMVGPVHIPLGDIWRALVSRVPTSPTDKIIRLIRFNKAVVALCAGASLSVSGLLMQTLFRNPLAGPHILGINAGASFGVALFLLGTPLSLSTSLLSSFGIAGSAWLGAAAVFLLIAAVSRRIKDIMAILIIGMMLSSGIGAVTQILQYLSHEDALKSFVIWTMGSLGDVTAQQLNLLLPVTAFGLLMAAVLSKPLNMLLLGENYARSMGLNLHHSRLLIFLSTTLLAGTVTAFCGPIGFIGLAVPHVVRAIFRTSDHRVAIPATVVSGAVVMLICDIISKSFVLPINTVTAILGIPIVIWIVLRNKNIF